MNNLRVALSLLVCIPIAAISTTVAHAEEHDRGAAFKPYSGQPGKDVVWVPTPEATVEMVLDLAEVTPQDYVVDLGSGDGRMIIAAGRRGVRGHGVEYNPNMVALSNKRAKEAGVDDKVTFVHGDMYEADISKATVLPLFLLSKNLNRLAPKFLELQPGTRIVTVNYEITDWTHEKTVTLDDCRTWCRAIKYVVPANVAGEWRMGEGKLDLAQTAQQFTGTMGGDPIEKGRLRGNDISFESGGTRFVGRVMDNEMRGTATGVRAGSWIARRPLAAD